MKQTKTHKVRYLLWLLLAVLPFFSCAARINGALAADGSASLSVNISLEPRMESLIRRLSAAGGVDVSANSPVLDAQSINASMSRASGISSVLLRNTSPSAVEGQVRISQISDFLSAQGRFIEFEQGRSGGKCRIRLSLENGPEIIRFLSPEIDDYLNALMAPIATGEELSKTEYLELVTSVYNKPVSDEIASSRVRASIDFPGSITSVRGGTFSGRRAEFDIPLVDLLVLDVPLIYEAEWR